MAARKLISTPKGTTVVLWNKKSYAVGDEVPDDFPADKLQAPAPDEDPAAVGTEPTSEDSGETKGKKGKRK